MKKVIRFGFAIAIVSIFLFASYGLSEEKISALDFQLPDLEGEFVTLSNYKDRQPVLLFFLTTWCHLCQDETKVLNNKYASLVKDGLQVLAIDIGESKKSVARFAKRHGLTYRVLLDSDASVAYAYEIVGVPTYVLIDKEGHVIFMDNYFPFQSYKDFLLLKESKNE